MQEVGENEKQGREEMELVPCRVATIGQEAGTEAVLLFSRGGLVAVMFPVCYYHASSAVI